MGGGNTGVARALSAARVGAVPFVGHDLDADNLALLRTGVLTAVLHHDLRADLRAALTQLLRAHRLLPGAAGVGALGAAGRHAVERPARACAPDTIPDLVRLTHRSRRRRPVGTVRTSHEVR